MSRSDASFLLPSGRAVHVNAFLVEVTGVQENAPFADLDVPRRFATAVGALRAAATRVRPGAPLVLLDPWARSLVPPEGRTHPSRWTCVAWLGSGPVRPDADGSELVVGWLADELPEIVPALSTVTATLDWDEHARDFAF